MVIELDGVIFSIFKHDGWKSRRRTLGSFHVSVAFRHFFSIDSHREKNTR